MSCKYCKNAEPLPIDGVGVFTVLKYTNGIGKDYWFVEFECCDDIFDNEVYIKSCFDINYCPMCGEKL